MDDLDGHIAVKDATAKLTGAELLFGRPQVAGRKSRPPAMAILRPLTEADLEERQLFGADETSNKGLVKLRDTHHKAAKLMADGRTIAYISLKTGYSPATLYTLRADPAFQELLEFYKTQKQEAYIDTHERLASLAQESIGELRDRLADNPDDVKTAELMEMAKLGLDRSGFGPTSTQHTVNASISASDLLQLKEIADRNETGVKLVQARKETASSEGERPQNSEGVGESVDAEEAAFFDASEVERQPGEGKDLRENNRPQVVEDVSKGRA